MGKGKHERRVGWQERLWTDGSGKGLAFGWWWKCEGICHRRRERGKDFREVGRGGYG